MTFESETKKLISIKVTDHFSAANKAKGWGRPNMLVLALGDEILGLEGKLVKHVKEFQDKNAGKIFWDGGWEG